MIRFGEIMTPSFISSHVPLREKDLSIRLKLNVTRLAPSEGHNVTQLQLTGSVDVEQPLRWLTVQFHYSTTFVSSRNWTVHLELGMHVISVFLTRCHTQPEPPDIKPLPDSTQSSPV